MAKKDGFDQVLADAEMYLGVNKEKLFDVLSQYDVLGSEEDNLLEEIERVTEALEGTR